VIILTALWILTMKEVLAPLYRQGNWGLGRVSSWREWIW
jgi:hypothetical protein